MLYNISTAHILAPQLAHARQLITLLPQNTWV